MKKLVRKLQGHTDHLLGCFIGLKEKYAFLQPMIFDEKVVGKFGWGMKNRGFVTIRRALLFDCIQDLAKLGFDTDDRTPSIQNIFDSIQRTPTVLNHFRDSFSSWGIAIPASENPLTKEVLKEANHREQLRLRARFDELFANVTDRWTVFSQKEPVNAFRVIRDRLTAHLELRLIEGEYQYTDINDLGLTWGDLGQGISDIESIVLDLNLLIRNASFAMDGLNDSLETAKNNFWS